jgi:exopolyphosphatase/guanosine-5'-triphosphate,3'-diphosphate pyrophosphatase
MKAAALDIGSNTVKITLFDRKKSGELVVIGKKKIAVGLIGYLQDGKISQEGIEALLSAILDLSAFSKKHKCTKIFPFATAALRVAENRDLIQEKILQETALKVDLLDGLCEAALTYESLQFSLGKSLSTDGIVLDMGGGSTELTLFHGSQIVSSVSLPFGALNLWQKFVANILPVQGEAIQIAAFVQKTLLESSFPIHKAKGNLYVNGGSGCALIHFITALDNPLLNQSDPQLPQTISIKRLKLVIADLLALKDTTKRTLIREVPDRVHTLPTAAIGLCTLAETLGYDQIQITDAGIRDAYLRRILSRKKGKKGEKEELQADDQGS